MAQVFFYLILIIIVADFILDRIIDYLNTTRWSDELPEELTDFYKPDQYKKSQQYERQKHRLSLFIDTVSFIGVLLILIPGGFAWLDNILRGFTSNPIILTLLFFGIICLIAGIVSLPFEIYSVFIIEARYGFNTTTPRTFILDKLKGLFLSIMIGGGLMCLVVWIYYETGEWFWFLVWCVMSFFILFFSMFYSSLIVPLFNKQKALEQGALRDTIESFAASVGFKIRDIYIIDGSKRSNKANAYFSGLGIKKRIVLFDTLCRSHPVVEIVAVLAHEIGHFKNRHISIGIFLSIFQTGLMLFILSFFVKPGDPLTKSLCQALSGLSNMDVVPSFHLGILGFGLLYNPLSVVTGILMNMLSRHNELTADRFAGRKYGASYLQSALKRLSVTHLSNLRPHPWFVFFHYSHPPLLKRLQALERIKDPFST